uniref:nitrilase-related carbon-nitrogen hydrolase n=1 Tax=uncultured Alistipes sp. TaxID=538949 RepID=UPI002666BB81
MKLNVAICQVDMEWEETEHNLSRIEKVVAEAAADVVVLPEMFATGFKLRPSVVAETMDGPVVTAMRRWAREYDKAVVGSVVILEDGIYRNRMLFVEPSGKMTQYDKHHLFRPGGEGRDYTPGKRRVVVEYKGFRCLMQVCYDLRFPVFSRNRGDYDA